MSPIYHPDYYPHHPLRCSLSDAHWNHVVSSPFFASFVHADGLQHLVLAIVIIIIEGAFDIVVL